MSECSVPEMLVTEDNVKIHGSRHDFAVLVSKLSRVMNQVGHIEKSGYNQFYNYEYATESDVVREVRRHLCSEQVFLFSTVKDWQVDEFKGKNGTQNRVRVELLFTFADGETGASCTVCYIGEGIDSGDKAFYKAYTGAVKYAVMKNFLIPTGDDPEEYILAQNGNGVTDDNMDEKASDRELLAEGEPLNVIRRIYRHHPEVVQQAAFKRLQARDMAEDISLLTELDDGDLQSILQEIMDRLQKQVAS